jgi:hypothetical protein
MGLLRDLRVQADFVIDASWRLMAMQDTHPLSPTCGSFHYAYWRDKTSEFPDARFQEAGATLALLSLPAFNAVRAAGRLAPTPRLYQGFANALLAWERQQYSDGPFDEWYKGERGFAATEFTVIAFCLARRFLGERIAPAHDTQLVRVVAKAASWLARRDDPIKANHEAAAAAALALAWETTGDVAFRAAAKSKLENTLARQHPEGWFPEVGGMDLGYCSVLLDYVMIYTLVTGDEAAIPAMRRLFDFMLPLLHPDGTISPEMGLCLNPYVSRVGLGLLSALHAPCAQLMAYFGEHSPGIEALRPYLADDLRLARWSHLPLVATLLADRFRADPDGPAAFARSFPDGMTRAKAAGVCAFHRRDLHVYCSAAGGGTLRVFRGDQCIYEDQGPWLDTPERGYCVAGYDPERPLDCRTDSLTLLARLGAAHFFFPGLLSRLILRFGSTTALGSRLLRAAIDFVRVRRRTASNQSAAPIASADSPYALEREVRIEGNLFQVVDRLSSEAAAIDPATLMSAVTFRGERRLLPASGAAAASFTIVKSFDPSATDGFEWSIEPSRNVGATAGQS